jgi:predicted RND superfamily exporter protein
MAVVILGGLITSTLLNLFVLPSLYLRFGKSRTHRAPTAPPQASAEGGSNVSQLRSEATAAGHR